MQQTDLHSDANQKKMFIKTYGCQMNFYDSEKMGGTMGNHGFQLEKEISDECDLIVLNTCHIREKASEKMYSDLGRIKKFKDKRKAEGKPTIVAVAGCVAQAEGSEIKSRAPYVDIVVGPQSYQRLPMLVKNAEAGAKGNVELDFSTIDKFDFLLEEIENEKAPKDIHDVKSSAFLTIQEGCDKFCTFCVVPYTRGAEVSRDVNQIYREALLLAERGTLELNLLGQNVNAYHGKAPDNSTWSLAKLIEKLSNIPQIQRIRYTTSHPRDMEDDLINAHRDFPKLMPFVHLPIQSGSDKILKAMNRKHTADDYRRIIDKFRNVRPDIEFSSDFIIGFPGETEEDFRDTLKLINDVNFTLSYSFIYSARPGTPGANLEDATPASVKKERLNELQALIDKQMFERLADKVDRKMKVLFTRKGKFENHLVGFTEYYQPVIIENHPEFMNKIVEVEIKEAKERALVGVAISK
ncbi:MAG: tRNA (N6-isopentenyl adenosine(37)-C2)-methylthiotransferase MiaB [Rickettsiales bacterium]|nr:tRNA (N6-isopentenyl adenosine(37)-C2)-methylthiotransferase MiaB [Rickettsiales bacterium]